MSLRSYQVAHPPSKPLVLFDGDCRFCRHWAEAWQRNFGAVLDVASSQSTGGRFPEIPAAEFDTAMQLIEPDGSVYSGPVAVLRARALGKRHRGFLLRAYEGSAFAAGLLNFGYRLIARNRRVFSFFMR